MQKPGEPITLQDSLFGGLEPRTKSLGTKVRGRSYGLLLSQIPEGIEDNFIDPDNLIETLREFFEVQLHGKKIIPIMKKGDAYSDPTGKLREYLEKLYGTVVPLTGTSTSDLIGGYYDDGIITELQSEEGVSVSWYIYAESKEDTGTIENPVAESVDVSHLKGLIKKEQGYISTLYKVVVNRYVDRLTGVGTMRIVDSIAESSDRDILFSDIKGFKLINDTFDHDIGDRAIQHFAESIRECLQLRRGEYIVRKGGDEFIIITPKAARKRMEGFSDRLTKYLMEHPFRFKHKGVTHSRVLEAVSVGHLADGNTTTQQAIKQLSDEVTEAGGGAIYKSGKRLAETGRKQNMTREEFLAMMEKAWDDTEK